MSGGIPCAHDAHRQIRAAVRGICDGLSDMRWGVRLTRTAPVSRELILNYVAGHSLGLPRSYQPRRAALGGAGGVYGLPPYGPDPVAL